MKRIQLQKKLNLAKVTVADLNDPEMNHIQGGSEERNKNSSRWDTCKIYVYTVNIPTPCFSELIK